jgi:hypothetical protein
MKDYIKQSLREELVNEKLMLKNWDEYVILVSNAYNNAKNYDSSVVGHWKALNTSNYTLFKRLLSKVNVVFVTNDQNKVGSINILGKDFKIEYIKPGDEYQTQSEMKQSFDETGILKISIDYSTHPVFSVADNIVFRTVHDYIVHILGGHNFGVRGEIAAYNRHAKLAPKEAIPALFTEVVGQVCVTISTGSFPKQKIALLNGFDYQNVGVIDDTNYEIIDKTLVNKSKINKEVPNNKLQNRKEPTAIREPEPELDLAQLVREKLNESLSLPQNSNISQEELSHLKTINWSDIIIDEAGDDGNNTLYMKVIFKDNNLNRLSDGIKLSIQLLHDTYYQPHMFLAPSLQGIGLGPKILKCFIMEFGHIYAGNGRTLNQDANKMLSKLTNDPDLESFRDEIGLLIMKKGNPNRDTLLKIID